MTTSATQPALLSNCAAWPPEGASPRLLAHLADGGVIAPGSLEHGADCPGPDRDARCSLVSLLGARPLCEDAAWYTRDDPAAPWRPCEPPREAARADDVAPACPIALLDGSSWQPGRAEEIIAWAQRRSRRRRRGVGEAD